MGGRFSLEPSGQLEPKDPEAKASVASRAGTWELLPSGPDVLVFLRGSAARVAAGGPKVVLTGDVAGFALSDLIAFLSQSRWSGTVSLRNGRGYRQLGLKDGDVRAASSDEPREALGEVMARLGYVTHQEIRQVLDAQPPSRLGKALVDFGLVKPHDLYKCLHQQVAEIFHAMVVSKEGVFFLVDHPPDDRAQGLQIPTQSLLMDSIRQIDEMAHFRKRIPHGQMYVAPKRASDGKLEADEDRVLALVNGEQTILELAAAARVTEFDLTKIVFRLLEGGYVHLTERQAAASAAASAAGAKSAGARQVVRAFNLVFRDITQQVAQAGKQEAFLTSATGALSGNAPVLEGLAFDGSGQLDETLLLQRFERFQEDLGSQPVAGLKQALSDVMFFLLFQAGELLEAEGDEALAARVKSRLSALEEG